MLFNKNKMILTVEGMHCENCKKKVTEILSNINDIKKVKVDLNNKQVTIYPSKEIDSSYLANILKESGYELKKVDVIWKGTEK